MVTIKDIASQAGVSPGTVSLVLNGKAKENRISQKTVNRVVEIAQQLDYQPSQIARALRLQKSLTFGLIVPNIYGTFFADIVEHIQKTVYQNEYALSICISGQDPDLEQECIRFQRRNGVDGLLILPVGTEYGHILSLVEDHFPLVLLYRYFDDLNVFAVITNNYQGAYDATQHMVQKGHIRIGILSGAMDNSVYQDRIRGVRNAFRDHAVPFCDELVSRAEYSVESAIVAARSLFSLPDPPTGIISFGELLTYGILKYLQNQNLNIPEDVSLISLHESEFAPVYNPPLTMVSQPVGEIEKNAVNLLFRQIENNEEHGEPLEPEHIILDTNLIVGESVSDIS